MIRLSFVLLVAVWQQTSYQDALREARRLGEQQRFEEALASAEALVASKPRRSEGYFLLGDLYRRQWRPSEAVEVFSRGLDETKGQAADLHRDIAVTYAEVHVWDRALEHVENALSKRPDHATSLYVKAMVLSQTGHWSEALRVYEALSAKEPDNASLHFRIGEVHESVNRLDEAEAAYRRALELDPATSGASFRLGKMLVASGQLKEAERQMARAVRLASDHAESHLELAQMLDGLERTTKARYHFEKALELDPSLAKAYLSYGNFAARHGEREHGKELLAKFQELTAVEKQITDLMGTVDFTPEDLEAKDELASFLIEHGQFPLALRAAQQYQLADPEEVRHHLLAARIYNAWGRHEDARRTLERAAAVFPDSAAVKRALEGDSR